MKLPMRLPPRTDTWPAQRRPPACLAALAQSSVVSPASTAVTSETSHPGISEACCLSLSLSEREMRRPPSLSVDFANQLVASPASSRHERLLGGKISHFPPGRGLC